MSDRTAHDALIYEAKLAFREADEAYRRALSLAAFKQSAVRAALNGGVPAAELAAALGLSRQRVYITARGNKLARDLRVTGDAL